jgi:iron complex outermembrane receptor protein
VHLRFHRCLLPGLIALLASAGIAASDESDRILVTATRLDPEQLQARGHVTVITAGDIERSTARNLPELLGREAGVLTRSLYGNNGSRASVDIRGFGAAATQNTLILLDGRRLNDVDLSAVDYSAIPLQSIERIEIIRNGGSVLYGDGASGGTINIITRTPDRAGTAGFIKAGAGNPGTRQLDAHASHNTGAVALLVGAHGIHSDGYRDNNDLEQSSLNGDLRYTRQDGELFLKAWWDDQDLELPGPRNVNPGLGIDELSDDRKGTGTPDDYADQRGYSLATGYTHYWDNGAEAVLDLGFRSKNQQAFFDDYAFGGIFADYLDSDLQTWSLTPRIILPHRLAGRTTQTIAGIDYYNSDYDSDRSLNESTRDRPIHRLSVEQSSMAAYIDTGITLSDSLHLNLGGRIQRVEQEGRDDFDPDAPGAVDKFESGAPDFNQDDTEYLLEAGIEQQLGPATAIYLKGSRSVRFATVDELFEIDPASFLRVFSPLDPQTGRGIDLGVTYRRNGLSGQANAWYMDLDDEIHFNPVTFSNVNLDPTRRYGLELSGSVTLFSRLDLRANYSLIRSEFRDGPFDGNDVPLVPRHTAGLQGTWRQTPTTDFTVALNHVSNRYFDNDQDNDFGEKIPSYRTVDLQAGHVYRGYRLAARVNNLLADKHFDYGVSSTFSPGAYNAYPLPERTFLFTVSREFSS